MMRGVLILGFGALVGALAGVGFFGVLYLLMGSRAWHKPKHTNVGRIHIRVSPEAAAMSSQILSALDQLDFQHRGRKAD